MSALTRTWVEALDFFPAACLDGLGEREGVREALAGDRCGFAVAVAAVLVLRFEPSDAFALLLDVAVDVADFRDEAPLLGRLDERALIPGSFFVLGDFICSEEYRKPLQLTIGGETG